MCNVRTVPYGRLEPCALRNVVEWLGARLHVLGRPVVEVARDLGGGPRIARVKH
jgi:hypothetical protein